MKSLKITKLSAYGLKPLLLSEPSMIWDHLYTSGEVDYRIVFGDNYFELGVGNKIVIQL